MNATTAPQTRQLEHLFDAELQYIEGKPRVSDEGKVGEYVGSGEGTVLGDKINGTVHWTLFEAQGETVCESNLFGVITTDDGIEIKFDTMGFFMRPDEKAPYKWITSAAVRFVSESARYDWLNSILGVWEGAFDMASYRHRYKAYVRWNEPAHLSHR